IPSNLLFDSDGQLQYIDNEWTFMQTLPVPFVLFRGLLIIGTELAPWPAHCLRPLLPSYSCKAFIQYCLGMISRELSHDEFERYLHLEWSFQQEVFLRQLPPFPQFFERVSAPVSEPGTMMQIIEEQRASLAQLDEDLKAAQGTIATIHRTK